MYARLGIFDPTSILRQIIEHKQIMHGLATSAFLDLKAALDSVGHLSLALIEWQAREIYSTYPIAVCEYPKPSPRL